MAAVLCKGIGEACKGLGEIVCLPCKCLGVGFKQFGDVLSTPFFCYIAVTYVCNIPAVIFGARSVMNGWCSNYTSWLLVNLVGAVIHMVGSVYIASKISSDEEPREEPNEAPSLAAVTGVEDGAKEKGKESSVPVATATPTTPSAPPVTEETNLTANVQNFFSLRENEHGAPNSSARIKHILCYDPVTAFYMLVFIGWFIWLCIGVSRLASGNDFDVQDCVDDQLGLIGPALICGFIYLGLFWCTFCCSICCLK